LAHRRKDGNAIRYVFSNPIAKCIYLVISIAIIQIFVTKYRFPEETIGSIIRIARRYFYYAIFFPALYILLDDKKFARFLKLAIGSVVVFCVIFIAQFLAGPEHKLFLWPVNVEYQVLQGFRVTRIYVDGTMAATLLFTVSFMFLLFSRGFKYSLQNIIIFLITIFQNIVTFGRANIFGIITGILFSIAVTQARSRIKNILKVVLALACASALIWAGFLIFSTKGSELPKAAFYRFGSAYTAFSQSEDTFIARVQDNLGRMSLVKKNYIFGIGFVHDESSLFASARGTAESGIRTSDSGILTLLLDMGIVGVLWLFAMTVIFFKRSTFIYRRTAGQPYGAVVLGIIAFYFSRLFSFITLADFVLYDGIVTMMVAFAILEAINYRILPETNE
jgi:hypothetical protein